MTFANYLKFLRISFNASPQEIKRAYSKLSKKFHSGRNGVEFLAGTLSRYRKFKRCFLIPKN
jgi:curved DNA-binding protein CbpA